MIGSIVRGKEGRRIVLLKAGDAYLCQEISDVPVVRNNIIDQITTTNGTEYLGVNLFFGPLPSKEVLAEAENPDDLTRSLLVSLEIAEFLMTIIRTWGSGDAPPWALSSTDDLLAYFRWLTGEVDNLSRSAEIPR